MTPMDVKMWMTREPIVAAPSLSIKAAWRLLQERRIRHLPVVEEGKLEMEAPVGRYLPPLAAPRVYRSGKPPELQTEPAERPMTVRDLMRHTSGLTYGFYGVSIVDALYLREGILAPDTDLAQLVEKLGRLPLLDQPGRAFNYSLSTDVLGRIVEIVSGRPLDAFLEERIFRPLGMADTGFFVAPEKLDRILEELR